MQSNTAVVSLHSTHHPLTPLNQPPPPPAAASAAVPTLSADDAVPTASDGEARLGEPGAKGVPLRALC